jgi:hypothetical protein
MEINKVFVVAYSLEILGEAYSNTQSTKPLNINEDIKQLHENSSYLDQNPNESLQEQAISVGGKIADYEMSSQVAAVVSRVEEAKQKFESDSLPESDLTSLRSEIDDLNFRFGFQGEEFETFNQASRELRALEERIHCKNLTSQTKRVTLPTGTFSGELMKLDLDQRQEHAMDLLCLVDPLLSDELKEFFDVFNHLPSRIKEEYNGEIARRGGSLLDLGSERDINAIRAQAEKAMLTAVALAFFLVGKDTSQVDAELAGMKDENRKAKELERAEKNKRSKK